MQDVHEPIESYNRFQSRPDQYKCTFNSSAIISGTVLRPERGAGEGRILDAVLLVHIGNLGTLFHSHNRLACMHLP